MTPKTKSNLLSGVVVIAAFALVAYVANGRPKRTHAKENATLLVNFAAEVSCLTLQHVSHDKGSPEDLLRATSEVNEMLRAVTINDVRRETFALTFVPTNVGGVPAFKFAVDNSRAAERGWSTTFRSAVDSEAQRRTVLNSTEANADGGESCRSALVRFGRRAKSGLDTTARSEAQFQPG